MKKENKYPFNALNNGTPKQGDFEILFAQPAAKLDLMFAPKDLLDYIQIPNPDCDFDGAKYNPYEIEENKIK